MSIDEPQKKDLEISARRKSFERIMAQNEAVMLRVARRMCQGDADRAQDLVQDSLVNAYRAFIDGRFREGTNARAWLLTILTNVYRNDSRRARREATSENLEEIVSGEKEVTSPFVAEKPTGPAEAVLESSLAEPLEKALSGLSDEFRTCVILVDVEGLEYAEAAAALGIPIGTVRSRLARARLQLHALLYDYAKSLRRV